MSRVNQAAKKKTFTIEDSDESFCRSVSDDDVITDHSNERINKLNESEKIESWSTEGCFHDILIRRDSCNVSCLHENHEWVVSQDRDDDNHEYSQDEACSMKSIWNSNDPWSNDRVNVIESCLWEICEWYALLRVNRRLDIIGPFNDNQFLWVTCLDGRILVLLPNIRQQDNISHCHLETTQKLQWGCSTFYVITNRNYSKLLVVTKRPRLHQRWAWKVSM